MQPLLLLEKKLHTHRLPGDCSSCSAFNWQLRHSSWQHSDFFKSTGLEEGCSHTKVVLWLLACQNARLQAFAILYKHVFINQTQGKPAFLTGLSN